MFWVSYMLESPKAFFLSRRAPTATFHDSKHSIIHMQYEPTRGWLLTSGTDKIIKVSNCSHSNVSVLFDKEIKLVLISVVCLHPAMGHDSSGIMRILCIVWSQELRISAENWTENHVFVEKRSEFRSLSMGSFISWRNNSRISWHWTDIV